MDRQERRELTIFNEMVRRHKEALIEVKTISNKNYKQDEQTSRLGELFPTEAQENAKQQQQ